MHSSYTPREVYGSPTATAHFVSPPRKTSNVLDLPPPTSRHHNHNHSNLYSSSGSTHAGGNVTPAAAAAPPLSSSLPSPYRGTYLDNAPDGMPSTDADGYHIRYVEVEVEEEVIVPVPVICHVQVEKFVPKVEEVWVDKVVEVPQIVYQDRRVDVPIIEEYETRVARKEIVTREQEVIRRVPKIENVIVEKVVEVPGNVIEVPKPYTVENTVYVPRVIDKQVPVLVAQVVQPQLTGLDDEVREFVIPTYEPKFHVVDVPVAMPVPSTLINRGVLSETCRVVQVPAGQYNTILRHMNQHLDCPDKQQYLPYVPDPYTQRVEFIEDYMPNGPIAVPMPLLNSPAPAVAGAKIAAPLVPNASGSGQLDVIMRQVREEELPTMPILGEDGQYQQQYQQQQQQQMQQQPRSARHHGKPRSHRSYRHHNNGSRHRHSQHPTQSRVSPEQEKYLDSRQHVGRLSVR